MLSTNVYVCGTRHDHGTASHLIADACRRKTVHEDRRRPLRRDGAVTGRAAAMGFPCVGLAMLPARVRENVGAGDGVRAGRVARLTSKNAPYKGRDDAQLGAFLDYPLYGGYYVVLI